MSGATSTSGELRALARAKGSLELDAPVGSWEGASGQAATAKRGMLFLILTLSSMFLLLCSASWMRMRGFDWVSPVLPWQLWLSSGLLFGASVLFEGARRADLAVQASRSWLVGATLATLLFLLSQYWVWQLMQSAGYYLASNPAVSFFYLLTGLHALHVLVGLLVLGRVLRAAASGNRLGVQLCAWYWHFLLGIWLVVFAVLWLS